MFQWGPYKPADYGTNIDWTINPADDIEWVAAIYRFYWADDLAKAYAATRDDKYARAFVELTTDWIAKHPLDDWTRTHPTLTHWKGFAWLDLQTGIRATRAVAAFKAMLHSDAVTPEFLAHLPGQPVRPPAQDRDDPHGGGAQQGHFRAAWRA